MKIPFNKPFIVGKEMFYIAQAVLGGHLAGDGKFTRKCHDWMEERFSARKVLLTHSCTSALEMAAILCDIQPGDEIIMPSFTFVSTANAFVLRGGKIRFVDINEGSLNLDETLIETLITPATRAIVPVHYAGMACDMNAIVKIAKTHNLLVIEDAAQGVNAKYNDKYLGTIGSLGAYSFHETKTFISGEGGALVINDERFIERAEIIREKGTNRTRFFKGEVDKYTWLDIGSSYLPSELIAAFLFAQLEAFDQIIAKRKGIIDYYNQHLEKLGQNGLIVLPNVPDNCQPNYHMYYILLPDATQRDAMLTHLNEKGVHAVFHYLPLHNSVMGRKMGYRPGDFPVTEDIAGRLIRLPCYYSLKEDELSYIVEAVEEFFRTKQNGMTKREAAK